MTFKKISFAPSGSEALFYMLSALTEDEKEEAEEIIRYYISTNSENSFAFSVVGSCLSVRVFDGEEYSFVFPHELSDKSNVYEAVAENVRYAALEEISPIFISVPAVDARVFFDLGYRHADCDADSTEADSYRITLKNELSFLDLCPSAESDGLTLSPFTEDDSADYERLLSDTKNNRFWGYDYREDYGEDVSGDFLLSLAIREFEAASALSLAIREKGKLIGEAVLHAFDYKGGADISIRILPEYQNKGFGSNALSLLLDIAESMGLIKLYARVNFENHPSISLFSKFADKKEETENYAVFTYELRS